jgi:thiamine pyrophosphokinase
MHVQIFLGAWPLGAPMWIPKTAERSIAVDGGIQLCAQEFSDWTDRIDTLIGDLDSISDEARRATETAGIEIRELPREKDETDFEAAIQLAIERGATSVHVTNGMGDRLDHLIMVQRGLESIPAAISVSAQIGSAACWRVTPNTPIELEVSVGSIFSLIPGCSGVGGVSTRGLRWILENATLAATSARSISNLVTEPIVRVAVSTGSLCAISPNEFERTIS